MNKDGSVSESFNLEVDKNYTRLNSNININYVMNGDSNLNYSKWNIFWQMRKIKLGNECELVQPKLFGYAKL